MVGLCWTHTCLQVLKFQHPGYDSRSWEEGQTQACTQLQTPCFRAFAGEQQAHAYSPLSPSVTHTHIPGCPGEHSCVTTTKDWWFCQRQVSWPLSLWSLCRGCQASTGVSSNLLSGTAVLVGGVLLPSCSLEFLLFPGVKCWAVRHELELLHGCIEKVEILLPLSGKHNTGCGFFILGTWCRSSVFKVQYCPSFPHSCRF